MSYWNKVKKNIKNVFITQYNDREIFIEAAARRGDAPSKSLVKTTKSLHIQNIENWRMAVTFASDPEHPDRQKLLEVYDAIMRDNHLAAIIDSRILRVRRSKFKILKQSDRTENEDLKALFETQWFDDFLKLILSSIFCGTKVIEIYDLEEDGQVARITEIPMQYVNPVKGIIAKEIGDEKGWKYKEPPYRKYFLQIGENFDLGMLADIAPIPLAKKFTTGTWMDYIEKYGISPRWVITPYGDTNRQKELATMMEEMVSAHYAILQGDEKIEIADLKQADAFKVFNEFIERANSEMSKRVLGATGTVDEKAFVGGAKVHQEVANDRHESDKLFAKNIINKYLFPMLIELSPVYAALKDHFFDWDDFNEMEQETMIDKAVSLSQYYTLDIAYLSEKTGIPILGIKDQSTVVPEDNESKKKSLKATLEYLDKLSSLYKEDCCGSPIVNNVQAVDLSSWTKVINDVARKLYNKQLKPEDLHQDLIYKIHGELESASSDGIDYNPTKFDYASVAMLKQVNANLYEFSSAKSFAELVAMNGKLIDKDGKVRSFTDFKSEVEKLNILFNRNYLRTEHQTALKSAQMAKKWLKFQERKGGISQLKICYCR